MNELEIEIDLDDDAWFKSYLHRVKQNRLKRENPWVVDLIRALASFPSGSHKSWVVGAMEKRRQALGLDTPVDFDANVRSCYNRYCIDNSAWKKAGAVPEEGLFYSPAGKGAGYWAMDRNRARAWIRSRFQRAAAESNA